ncbi:MAG: hypothetical protein ACOYNS_09810 [Bacteroidota bacterium]
MNFRLPYPNVVSSVPDLLMGLAFLVTWIEPTALGGDMVPYLFQVMLVEFIIIHSAGFMSGIIYGNEPKPKKLKYLLGLSLFYLLFILGFSLGFRSWWPLIAFGGLMFNRMMSVLTGQAEEGKEVEYAKNMWALNVVCYIVTVFAAIMLPLPELGVSPDNLSHLNMSGDFVDEPHKMMAWGFLYFTSVGYFELKNKNIIFKVSS